MVNKRLFTEAELKYYAYRYALHMFAWVTLGILLVEIVVWLVGESHRFYASSILVGIVIRAFLDVRKFRKKVDYEKLKT